MQTPITAQHPWVSRLLKELAISPEATKVVLTIEARSLVLVEIHSYATPIAQDVEPGKVVGLFKLVLVDDNAGEGTPA